MIEKNNALGGTRPFVIAAALVVIILGINLAQSVVSLILFSVFLALIGTPPVLWLQRKRVPSLIAVFIIMTCMVSIVLIIGIVVGASLSAFSEGLPFYQQRIQEEVLALKPILASKHIIVTDKMLLEYVNPGPIMGLVVGLLGEFGSALSDLVLVLLTVTFILLEVSSFPVKIRSIIGDPQRAFPQFRQFIKNIQRYVIIKTIINVVVGVIIGTWLLILGVDFPVLWGFVAFVLFYIPNIGSIISAIPAVITAFVGLGAGTAALAALGYVAVGTVIGNFIEPKLMGRQLGLSTLVVFLSLLLWGSMLGTIGVVLCIPFTMTLKFAFESNESTRWIAMVLGPEVIGSDKKINPVK
ncbi:MAG: AI-2E family transporter [Bacteroidota bacterium]